MDQHHHPRRRRAGWFSVIRAEGARKAFSFRDQAISAGKVLTCGKAGAWARTGSAMLQEWALARGQKRHQFGVVVVILGEQSRVISRERRSRRSLAVRRGGLWPLSSIGAPVSAGQEQGRVGFARSAMSLEATGNRRLPLHRGGQSQPDRVIGGRMANRLAIPPTMMCRGSRV